MGNVIRTYSISEETDEMIEQIASAERRNKSVIVELAIEALFNSFSRRQQEEQENSSEPSVEL